MIFTFGLMLIAAVFLCSIAYRRPAHLPIFLLAAGMLRFGGDVGDALVTDSSALWLLILICIAIVAIAGLRGVGAAGWPEKIYMMFLFWCAIEVIRADSKVYAIRSFLRLLYPFLMMTLCGKAAFIYKDLPSRVIVWTTRVAAWIGACFHPLIGALVPSIIMGQLVTLAWFGAPFYDFAALMCLLALARWKIAGQTRWAVLAAMLASAPLFGAVRTGLLAAAVGLSALSLLAYRVKALPVIAGIYLAAMSAFLLVPSLRDKMFVSSTTEVDHSELFGRPTEVSKDQINSNGRFALWDTVLEKFFWPAPMTGSGLGATQSWFYSGQALRDAGTPIKVEHSEYVKLLADTGIIGLSLFVAAAISLLVSAVPAYRATASAPQRILALAVVSSVPALLICMAFDNALLYVLAAAQYPFALSGILSGMQMRQRKPAIRFNVPLRDSISTASQPAVRRRRERFKVPLGGPAQNPSEQRG